ncbi:MAG: hypothetical protein JWM10_2429 [Myxococcaceae bacterium]|nr:hypothetical protein [Myxococcaceae bacterium]
MNPTPTALLLVALFAPTAAAVDRTTRPYRCVEHVHREAPGVDAHVVLIDLRCPAADVVATRPGDRHATVSGFAEEYGAQIAINANFFDASTCGLAMGDGRVWRDAYRDRCGASLAFGPQASGTRLAFWDSVDHPTSCELGWARQVITGWPRLLDRGAVVFEPEEPIGMYRFHPRTAIGATPGGATLVIAVVDGRRNGLPGMTSLGLIPLMEEFGVSDAINLDGGGSTELYIAAEGGVVNHPSDRVERRVGNHLGIRVLDP